MGEGCLSDTARVLCDYPNSSIQVAAYSNLLMSTTWWNELPADNILIFQPDTFMLDDTIEPWMKYGFVGAPWAPWLASRLTFQVAWRIAIG